MNPLDRIYGLHKELSAARLPVPRKTLEARLECAPATIKRIIRDMRLYLNAPIEYDRERNGYYYADAEGPRYELPGLWFNASEVISLLVMEQLLETTQPGLLDRDLAPIRKRLESVLASSHLGTGELSKRVRVLRAAARPPGAHFRSVAGALVQRKRLDITYRGRARDAETRRNISPQRLIYYRDNWYLDAWCHDAGGLRTFALERIEAAQTASTKARNIPDKTLDAELGAGYGIFSGAAAHTAVLRFGSAAARWAADARWHPDQTSAWLADGRFELRVPYARAEELIRDILAYGAEVQVIGPDSLRRAVAERLHNAAQLYR